MSERTIPWHRSVEALRFEYLTPADLAGVFALHEHVMAEVDPAVVHAEAQSFFDDILGGAGSIIGSFDGEELAGFSVFLSQRALLSPALESLGLPAGARVVELAGTNIKRPYRGNRLQVEFTRRRAQLARELGFEHVFATASPVNRPSWRNLLSGGLHIVDLISVFGGQRYVMHSNVRHPLHIDYASGHAVEAGDLETQRVSLAAGERAISYRQREAVLELLFATSHARE